MDRVTESWESLTKNFRYESLKRNQRKNISDEP